MRQSQTTTPSPYGNNTALQQPAPADAAPAGDVEMMTAELDDFLTGLVFPEDPTDFEVRDPLY